MTTSTVPHQNSDQAPTGLRHFFRHFSGPWGSPTVIVCALASVAMLGGCQSSSVTGILQGGQKGPVVSSSAPPPPNARVQHPAPATSAPRARTSPSFIPQLTRVTPADQAAPPPMMETVTPQAREGAVRVALLLPLTGRAAPIGRSMLNAAQLAMFQFANDDFELLTQDTAGITAGAADAVDMALADGARLIIGPLLADSVRAVKRQARAASVPVIAFSSDRTVAGGGVYTMGFLPGDQVRAVVTHAMSKGMSRFAFLGPDDDYGRTVRAALARAVAAGGATMVREGFYAPDGSNAADVIRELADYDARHQALLDQISELESKDDELSKLALRRLSNLQTIGDLPYEALLIADGGKRLQTVAAHLPFYDVDPAKVRMMGTGQWDVAGLGAEPALMGGWFAAPAPEFRKDFERQYAEIYGEAPHRLATLAYDAVALAAVLAQGANGPDYSDVRLTDAGGYAGRDGIFRFATDGTTERGLAVLQIVRRANRVIRRAPQTFDPATN